MTQWYRIYFRNRRTALAHGEAERDRLMGRKVPKAIHVEEAAEYTCETCGKASAWPTTSGVWADIDQEWRWYGRSTDIDAGEPVISFCSRACEPDSLNRDGRGKPEGVSWADFLSIHHYEPVKLNNWQALNDARTAANPRVFPFPEHPKERIAVGFCRWCGEEIIEKTGKRAGARSNRRTWHRHYQGDSRDCYHEFLLHTDTKAQYWALIERDGPGCGNCGKGSGKWVSGGLVFIREWEEKGWTSIQWSEKLEVDHIVPLWRRIYIECVDTVRAMFGIDNLWLLCVSCHRRKTSIEARERAEERT